MADPILYYLPGSSTVLALGGQSVQRSSSQNDLRTIFVRVPAETVLASLKQPINKDNSDKNIAVPGSSENPLATSASLVNVIDADKNSIFPISLLSKTPSRPKTRKTSTPNHVVSSASSPANSCVSLPSNDVHSSCTSSTPNPMTSHPISTQSSVTTFDSATADPVHYVTVPAAATPDSVATATISTPNNIHASSPLQARTPVANGRPVAARTSPKAPVKRPAETVASLVFFDLETTGLAHDIGKSNVQITEISLIAMGRKEFEGSTSSELKDIRLIQKLCLCIRPRAMVSRGASKVTGLDNYNLIEQKQFDRNVAATFSSFLAHLPKPACLLAHNGASYDFPLLKAEFKRLSIQLPPDILIADTLKAFRALGVPVFPPGKKVCKSVKYGKTGQLSYGLANLHLYFFNKHPTGSHSSEGDCIALAKVCHRMKDLILPWVDENCSIFDTINPMW